MNADSPGRARHRHKSPGSGWHVHGEPQDRHHRSLASGFDSLSAPAYGGFPMMTCAGRHFSICAMAHFCRTTCAPSRPSSGGQCGLPSSTISCCARTFGALSVRWWPGRRIRASRMPSWRFTRSSGWRWAAVVMPGRTSTVSAVNANHRRYPVRLTLAWRAVDRLPAVLCARRYREVYSAALGHLVGSRPQRPRRWASHCRRCSRRGRGAGRAGQVAAPKPGRSAARRWAGATAPTDGPNPASD